MPIGEAGSLTRGGFGDGEVVRVDFTEPLTNPVIMMTGTNAGGNEYTLTVVSVDANGFNFILDEWEDEDGPHPATETLNWLAIEEGVHTLPDGRVIEAGTTSATDATSNVSFDGTYTSPPVVLTNVMSYNETDVVDSDPFNVTSSGFDLALQEGALSDGVHAAETVGYIVIEPGASASDLSGSAQTTGPLTTGNSTYGLNDTFNDGIVLAETQTMNETDAGSVVIRSTTATDTVLTFDENSGGGSTAHAPENVGIAVFENGVIPCFTPGALIATARGRIDVADIKPGDMVLTADHGFQPVRWVSSTRLTKGQLKAKPDLAPILVRKDAFGPGLPCADMWVSPQHRFMVTGWNAQLLTGEREILVPAKAFLNDHSVTRAQATDTRYIHLLFDTHEVIYANDTPTESLLAGELDKAALTPAHRHELFRIFPDLRCFERNFGPAARRCLTPSEGALLS